MSKHLVTGTGTPVGSVTPDYIGQHYLDTTPDTYYQSTGLTNADWVTSAAGAVSSVNTLTGDVVLDADDIALDATLDINTPDHITSIQRAIDHVWSSAITDGGALTDNGDGTIGIAECNVMIRSSANVHVSLYNARVAAQTSISLTDDATNYVYLDYNAGTPQWVVGTTLTSFNRQDKMLGFMIHRAGTVLNYLDLREASLDQAAKSNHLFQDFARFIHKEGSTIISEPASLAIGFTEGEFFFTTEVITHVAFDTSIAGTANANVFDMHYQDGVGGWTHVINSKLIDVTTYDDGSGTPATLSNNSKYGVTWFYIINNTPSSLAAVMGQVEYNSEAEARAATSPSTLPSILSEGLGALVGVAIYNKTDTSFTDVLSPFTQTFTGTSATSHNSLGGLQGGTTSEYYHLTSAQHTNLPATITAAGGALLDDASASAQRTTLGLVIGTDVQAWDTDLDTYAGTPLTSGELTQLQNIDATVISSADWTALSNLSGTNSGDEVAATTTTAGISELATTAETNTGTDTGRTITPDGLAGSYAGTKVVTFATVNPTEDMATGDGKAYVHIPAALNGMDIVSAHAEVVTAGTTGTASIQVHNLNLAADVFSTLLTIDTAETGSDTATTPVVINTANDALATNDVLRMDIDAIHTTPAQGLIVTLECRLP